MKMELQEHDLVWKFLLLLICPHGREALEALNVWTSRTAQDRSSVFLFKCSHVPSPVHLQGLEWMCSLGDVALVPSHSRSLRAQQPHCLLGLTTCLYLWSSFSSPLCSSPPVQFSSVWISLQPSFPVSQYTHIHPHWLWVAKSHSLLGMLTTDCFIIN